MGTFLTAAWRKLIMAQYAVEPRVLEPWLPRGVELDLFAGRCYVSLVGFLFARVRVKGLAFPLHTRFEEVNLRFYVKRPLRDGRSGGEARRGVVFVSELVPRPAITWVARTIYEEPYATVPTRHKIAFEGDALDVRYEWKFGRRWHSMAVTAAAAPVAMRPGSVEEFITEHYWGYTKRRDGSTSAYAVEHPRWQVYPVRNVAIDADFGQLYGPAFAGLDAAKPDNVLLAEGSAVRVASAVGERM